MKNKSGQLQTPKRLAMRLQERSGNDQKNACGISKAIGFLNDGGLIRGTVIREVVRSSGCILIKTC